MALLGKKFPEILVGSVFIASLLFMMAFRQYCTWEMPRSPDVALGRTVAVFVNYGTTVYVTPLTQKILYGSYIFCGVSVVIFLVAFILARKTGSKKM